MLREIESRPNILKGELTLVSSGRSRKEEQAAGVDEELKEKKINPEEVARILDSKIKMNDSDFKKLLASVLNLPYAKARQLVGKVRRTS